MAFLKLIRAVNLFIIALSLSLFYYLILVPVHAARLQTTLLPLTNFEFVLFVLSVIFVAAAGNIINDYFDFEVDKEYKPERPLASGKISLDTAMYLHAALAFAGIALGFYLGWKNDNYQIGYIYIICVLLLYVYSSYLKKVPLAGNVVVAALSGFVFVLPMVFEAKFLNTIHFDGGLYAFDILLWQVRFYGGFAFIVSLAREIVKDIEDMEGDAAYNINTLAVQFGEKIAKGVAMVVLLAILGGVGFFMKRFWEVQAKGEFYYLLTLVVVPTVAAGVLLVMAKERQQYYRISLLLKVIMLLGILSIPAFYFINK